MKHCMFKLADFSVFFFNIYQVTFFNAGSTFVQNLVPLNPNVFCQYDVLARSK